MLVNEIVKLNTFLPFDAMAKTKKNRKNTVDLIKKVSKKQTSQNPFEVHVNKSKFNILGQKSKNDVGLPGVSRSKAIQKVRNISNYTSALSEHFFQTLSSTAWSYIMIEVLASIC